MHRFHCHSRNISGDKITISDASEAHHIRDVLRLKLRDEIIVFDEKGNGYKASIEKLSPGSVEVKVKEKARFVPEQKIKMTVACAIPKRTRMDDIIDKLTQLGTERIIPLITERMIVKLDKDKEISRLQRWRKIALSSAKQSQRSKLPVIDAVKNINEALLAKENFDLKLIPTLTDKGKSLSEVITKSKPKNILILIGPEGDFTPEEVAFALRCGCIPISLGDLVLRVETAAIAVTSFIKLYENH
jgi:16S rRNA (uracil1498-N3)-methyltransferase